MTNAELLAKIKAEIKRLQATNPSEYNCDNAVGYIWALNDILSFLSTLESENPMNQEGLEEGKRLMMEDAVKWLVDDDYHEASEKGRFILGSVGLGYNGYYIPYLDLLKLPKED